VCLLSDQSSCITSLAESFGYESAKLQGKIMDSVTLLKTCMKELQDEGRAKGWLRIYKHTRPPKHTYYRFDDTAVFIPYALSVGTTNNPRVCFPTPWRHRGIPGARLRASSQGPFTDFVRFEIKCKNRWSPISSNCFSIRILTESAAQQFLSRVRKSVGC